MTTRKNEHLNAEPVAPQAVENFLRRHPDFFANRLRLLSEMALPHDAGGAISLIERQVAVLRDQNHRYRRQLRELLSIAQENDRLIERLQQLTLALLDTHRLGDIVLLLQASLYEDFRVEAAALLLSAPPAPPLEPCARLEVGEIDAGQIRALFGKPVDDGAPLCGKLNRDQLSFLFGGAGQGIASAALLPLQAVPPFAPARRTLGILAIGSRDKSRFSAAMDTAFLKYMAELISRKLQPHLPGTPPA